MNKLAIFTAISLFFIPPAFAEDYKCAADAVQKAEKLLEFHFGVDDRIYIDPKVERLSPIKNPAGNGKYEVLQVWGDIYKGQYRMRMIYGMAGDDCILMGQEILEYANL